MTQPIEPERMSLARLSLYVTALERGPATSGGRFAWPPPLHRHLLAQARQDGIRHALSFHISECALEDGRFCLDRSEFSDPRHVVCVELVDERELLEAFCVRQRALLRDRTLLFTPAERWTFAEHLLQVGAI